MKSICGTLTVSSDELPHVNGKKHFDGKIKSICWKQSVQSIHLLTYIQHASELLVTSSLSVCQCGGGVSKLATKKFTPIYLV